MITFEIPGKPQPKQRARTVTGHSYTPERTVLYENWVRLCYGDRPKLTGPVVATIMLLYEVPKSYSGARRKRCLAGEEYPTGKHLGDVDNVAKSILDSLNGIAYHDDSQIVRLRIAKLYAKESKAIVALTEAKDEENG